MRNTRLTKLAALGAVAALTVAACGSDDDASTSTEAPAGTEAPAEADEPADTQAPAATDAPADEPADEPASDGILSAVCPETIVIQTDWFPEAEHGAMYQMVGENPSIDADKKVVNGPLVASGGVATGVNIEIRTGGPAVGFQQVVSLMAQDADVTFGYVATDEAIENYADNPTTAFVAPLEINPQIIMWDPATYPDVETIADLATAKDGDGVTIRYFETGAYMQFLLADGQVTDGQLDGSYDGGPSVFIAENGAIAQQGFASAEPFNYENVFTDWGKPVKFELIHDAGWQTYAAPLAVIDARKAELSDCMAAFAPIVQQSAIDYVTDPTATNELIVEAVNEYNDFWVYDAELGAASVQLQLDLGLVSNGPDATLGNFDEDRLSRFIEIAGPVFGVDGLTPGDLMTNEYIDASIGLPVPEEEEEESDGDDEAAEVGTIVDIAAGNPDFSTLVAAVQAAGLVDVLSGEGPFTVFAPTNAAFAALPEGLVDALLLPENLQDLLDILTYHAIIGEGVLSSDITSGSFPMAQGESVEVVADDNGVTINGANVIAADVVASNGVIHVIDAVLVPPSLDLSPLL